MQPRIYLADQHDIDFSQIDPDALEVIHRLQEAGYGAYLVGGGVRDLLAKKKPKDFDVSTSARPEEVKHLFRKNCLLIGRRFRLAHIRFGKKIIEVSTFRSGESAEHLIVRDNEWGSPEEDAVRRDFTINGLFYDPTEHHVIDYIGGWDDIHQGLLRTIGDPVIRFRQDPVRMIRLLKFQARFGFRIEPETAQAMELCRNDIAKSSPARVMEEIFRMLESGASEPFFRLLHQHGFMELLFPWLSHFLDTSNAESVFGLLGAVDETHRSVLIDRTLDRAILTSCLYYPILTQEIHAKFTEQQLLPQIGDVSTVAAALGRAVSSASFSHFPRRLRVVTHFIITLQYRLTPLNQKYHYRSRLTRHPDFPLALEFLRLRAMSDQKLKPVYEGWLSAMEESKAEAPEEEQGGYQPSHRPRRRRRPRGRGRYPNAPRT